MTDLTPRVSVAITTYNQERFIEAAVRSALDQDTDFPFEIVVGDDRSTDGTRALLSALRDLYPDKIRLLLHEANIGARANFLEVLKASRGEYLARLDGDDFWVDRDKLAAQVALLDGNPHLAMCFHTVVVCNEQGEITKMSKMRAKTVKASYGLPDILRKNFVPCCSIMFRRALLPGIPDWTAKYRSFPNDWVMSITLAQLGGIGFIDRPMAAYRSHGAANWRGTNLLKRLRKVSKIYTNVLPEIDAESARVARIARSRVRIRMAAQFAREGDTARARLYLRSALCGGSTTPAVWQEMLIFALDVYLPTLAKALRIARPRPALETDPRS